ncbi:MAG: hypothetical protein HY922_12470 [Elusimicrobia bacterium]|nr:hypothetical protein [Elusimicrobiota bacterium]
MPSETSGATRRFLSPRWAAACVLLLLGGLIIVERLHTFEEPLDRDVAAYAVMAHEMLSGRSLYSDLWEHRPPAMFLSYAAAEKLFGYGEHAVFLISVLGAWAILLGVFLAASSCGFGIRAGLWAAVFWAALSSDLFLQSNQPNTELFMNACALWAFVLLLRAEGLGRSLLVGALFGLAAAYKSLSAVSAALLLTSDLVFPGDRSAPWSSRLRSLGAMSAAAAALWALLIGYFWLRGSFGDFYDANVTFNRFYAGSGSQSLLASLQPRFLVPPALRSLLPFAALALSGAAWGLYKRERHWLLLAAWIVSAQIEIALHRKFHLHYYQLWLPPVLVGCGWALGLVEKLAGERRIELSKRRRFDTSKPMAFGRFGRGSAAANLAACALACLLAWRERPFYGLPAEDWPVVKVGHRYFPEAKKLGLELKDLLRRDEAFFQWGNEPELYFYSRRSPPTGILHIEPLLKGPLKERLSERVLRELENKRPPLAVISRWTFFGESAGHPAALWLARNYRGFAGNDRGHFVLMARKGSDLERRLLKRLK